ncbi:MAG: tRNA (guanosine(37)-N1)-methyltransferase TrmD [Armatimonadia bacterium]
MRIDIVTIFPDFVNQALSFSIIGRAISRGAVQAQAHDLRQWTHDAHRTVDDTPYGGGPGMVMKPEPFFEALDDLRAADTNDAHVILLTPQGRTFNQRMAERLSQRSHLIFLCGHYEGVDERVAALADEQISLGDFVLTGAELPALVITDAVVRLLPGVLGNEASPLEESFSGLLEYPQYTRPPEYRGLKVPDVLLGGHHEQVRVWRRREALRRTRDRRPDLLATAELTDEDWRLLGQLDGPAPED